MDLQQICVKLWCEVPGGSGKCKTAEIPAADGTPCGDKKVILEVLFQMVYSTNRSNYVKFIDVDL